MALTVTDVPAQSRYEVQEDGRTIGFAEYQKTAELVVFTHTEVEDGHEGQGVGSTLVRQALDDVRGQGLPVLPTCPFVESWMRRHPDYADLDYRNQPPRTDG